MNDPPPTEIVARLDPESARWLAELRASGPVREQAERRLHVLLHGIARAEAYRRRDRLPDDMRGDLDDLCLQAANDAAVAVLAKLDGFRGLSRFTTWAYKFAVLEISVRLRRRAWSARRLALDELEWGRLPDPGPGAAAQVEGRELLEQVRRAIETTLTPYQRQILLAAAVEEVPIDVLAERLGSTRGAIYKALHDARRRLREALRAAGHRWEES